LPREFFEVVNDKTFWSDIAMCVTILDPICKCIGVMECETSTMSTAYASFLYIYVQIRKQTASSDRLMLQKLEYQWDRIYSPVHALAFFCDPFFYSLRLAFVDRYGADALGLGKGDINSQCIAALKLITRLQQDSGKYDALIGDFLNLSVDMPSFVANAAPIMNYHARLLWGHCGGKYPHLAAALIKVYTGPASTAGVERQHKVGKRVHTARRNRTGGGKVERQVAVAHNTATARRTLTLSRHAFERILADACGSTVETLPDELTLAQERIDAHSADDGEARDIASDPIECLLSEEELTEQEDLCRALADVMCPEEIDDEHLFGEDDA